MQYVDIEKSYKWPLNCFTVEF